MTRPSYGGQAVIEGVMMAGPKGKAIAVRNEDGRLVYRIDEKPSFIKRHPAFRFPFLRGIVSFASSMVSGVQDLTWSAAQCGESEDDKLSTGGIIGAIVSAFIIAVVVFIAIPVFAASWLHPYVGDFGRSLIEGLLRVGIFIAYIVLISKMEDIRRLFAYHGAEHKTINAYEAGAHLDPETVSEYSRIHTRCGTSFIMMALILMIIIFTFIGQTTAIYRILIKIALLPVIAGISYELFRLPLYFPKSRFCHALVSPGLALQRLTTREPDQQQLAVAIAALTSVPGFEPNEAGYASKEQLEAAAAVKNPGSADIREDKNQTDSSGDEHR